MIKHLKKSECFHLRVIFNASDNSQSSNVFISSENAFMCFSSAELGFGFLSCITYGKCDSCLSVL